MNDVHIGCTAGRPDVSRSSSASLNISHGEHHERTSRGQRPGRFHPDAGCSSSHNGPLAGQIDSFEHTVGGG